MQDVHMNRYVQVHNVIFLKCNFVARNKTESEFYWNIKDCRNNTRSHFLLFEGKIWNPCPNGILFDIWLKLYNPSTLNIDLILWHTQLIVCALCSKMLNHALNNGLYLSLFKLIPMPHTLNFVGVGLFKFHIWILK